MIGLIALFSVAIWEFWERHELPFKEIVMTSKAFYEVRGRAMKSQQITSNPWEHLKVVILGLY